MSGVVFYDEIDGPVPLKSSIPLYGVLNLTCLNAKTINTINEILDLDMEDYQTFSRNESLMRRIATLFWYVAPQERHPKRIFQRSMVEYSDFIETVLPPLDDLTADGANPGEPSNGVNPGEHSSGPTLPIWFTGDRGFWIFPPSYITRGRSSLKSLIALWLSLEDIPPKNIEVVYNNQKNNVMIYNDKRNKIVYTLFKLCGNSDSICLKVDTSNVFARTFELQYEDTTYYTVALRYSAATTVDVKLLRFPEWNVEMAYSALFDGIVAKPDNSTNVKLKIE